MTGTITVTRTRDWLTPFEVEVRADGQKGSTARFAAASKAQAYALAHADESGFTLVYRTNPLDVSGVPTNSGNLETSSGRRVSVEEFQARYQRICAKCRQAKPLNQYRGLTHQNRTDGRLVFHGYADRCGECEATHGE